MVSDVKLSDEVNLSADISIFYGNCLELMNKMPDECIDLTVTSPPYDNLRKYNGMSEKEFEIIAKELYRVTKKGGVVVWVVGDATIKGSETGSSFKQVLYFKEQCGFNIHDTMIYASDKPPMTHNRYEQSFEYMFILSKGKPKTFNPIMIDCTYAGEKKTKRTFRHTGDNLGVTHLKGEVSPTKIKGNIWQYSTGYKKSSSDDIAFKHPAIFPESLARDHILSWSNENDLVFDCFLGSGTTAKMAVMNSRRFIGIDINKDYSLIAANRIKSLIESENHLITKVS